MWLLGIELRSPGRAEHSVLNLLTISIAKATFSEKTAPQNPSNLFYDSGFLWCATKVIGSQVLKTLLGWDVFSKEIKA